ncbi:hypothetical protein [Rhodococcus jostii]|uniref:Uncharacterized protein n=1 Tax=Rhodococcus jostii TaxID=132919 RepID=A0A1H4ISD9_RHOJO|nr:hypothetical protein [Rhodococcus jostii]SEB36969.1 hypothetical protein SAMN04490220_0460 [Rhodococcus jostii]
MKGSFVNFGFDEFENDDLRTDQLGIYVKEKPRGPGYVTDIVYVSRDLPVTVYAVLIDRGHGLEVAELELFRDYWGCDDGFGNYLHPDDQHDTDTHEDEDDDFGIPFDDEDEDQGPRPLITSDLLRRIPLGAIIARTEARLADMSWREDGVKTIMGPNKPVAELTESEQRALTTATSVRVRPRGRPTLSDDHLREVARAYLDEATRGTGLTRRLSKRFDRPEATIRDWIGAARRRGFLSAAAPGRRGASAGPHLNPP